MPPLSPRHPHPTFFGVKREFRLFGRRNWLVTFSGEPIASFPEREAALAMAEEEAMRSGQLGRPAEVRVDDGEGYVLVGSYGAGPAPTAAPHPEEPHDPERADDAGPF